MSHKYRMSYRPNRVRCFPHIKEATFLFLIFGMACTKGTSEMIVLAKSSSDTNKQAVSLEVAFITRLELKPTCLNELGVKDENDRH